MLYILQTAIPEERILEKGLASIYGLGKKSASSSLKYFGFSKDARGKDIRRYHRVSLKYAFDEYPRILKAELLNFHKNAIYRLMSSKCYRGRRHKAGLPVRGQRTHTNAKTKKPNYSSFKVTTLSKKFKLQKKK